MPLIVRYGHHSRARTNVPDLIARTDADCVSSAIEIISIPGSNQWHTKRVVASSSRREATARLDLAILVRHRVGFAASRNGLGAGGNDSCHSHHDRLAVGRPEGIWSRRTTDAGWRLWRSIDTCYRYAAGTAARINRVNAGR